MLKSIKKLSQELNLTENIVEVMQKVDRILTTNKIPHLLIGGIAVGNYDQPRTTKDVDFLVLPQDFNRIQVLFPSSGILSMPERDGFYSIVDEVEVDFIGTLDDNENKLLGNKEKYIDVPILSRNHLIFMKLKSRRSSDNNDVVQICKKMNLEDRDGFRKFLKVNDWETEDILEGFDECCLIADLENKNQNKEAGNKFRKMLYKRYLKD